jgi:DNA-binding NarL/FixJ family response regulator
LCGAILVLDLGLEMHQAGWGALIAPKLVPELLAVLGLGVSMPFMAGALMRMRARQEQMEKGLSVASGALSGMIEGYFAAWGLTPAEQAVATFTIKGYAIAEVAALRGSAEGTVKTHLNAIYRKAGVAGRAQLVSLLIEDLMRGPLVEPDRR